MNFPHRVTFRSASPVLTNAPTSFALVTGSPYGIFLDPRTGTLSGIPTEPGLYEFGVTATNSAGTGNGTITIYVASDLDEPPAPDEVSLETLPPPDRFYQEMDAFIQQLEQRNDVSDNVRNYVEKGRKVDQELLDPTSDKFIKNVARSTGNAINTFLNSLRCLKKRLVMRWKAS